MFIHAIVYSFNCLFMQLFVHLNVYSFKFLFIQLFTHLAVYSFICLFIQLLIIQLFIRSIVCSIKCLSIQLFHSNVYSFNFFIQLLVCCLCTQCLYVALCWVVCSVGTKLVNSTVWYDISRMQSLPWIGLLYVQPDACIALPISSLTFSLETVALGPAYLLALPCGYCWVIAFD